MALESLNLWTLVIVISQTLVSVIISVMVLDCRLSPEAQELNELTMMKLLYLYEPETCGRVFFYNFTMDVGEGRTNSKIVWPTSNKIAQTTRSRIQLWLSLHVIWTILAITNMTQSQRACGFYAALIPFTLTGVSILAIDVMHTSMYLADVSSIGADADVLNFIGQSSGITVKGIPGPIIKGLPSWLHRKDNPKDMTWMALLMAYCSCRGIVLWIINFWLIKDNYFEGLANYRRIENLVKIKISRKDRRGTRRDLV